MPTVNARRFTRASSHVIRCVAPPHFTGAYTFAEVIKRVTTSDFESTFSIGGAGSTAPDFVTSLSSTGQSQINTGGAASTEDNDAAWASTDLMLRVITCADAGTNAPIHHVKRDSVAWAHLTSDSDSTANMSDWTALSDEECRHGNWNGDFNYFNGIMVVRALFRGVDLSTNGTTNAAVEALAGGDRDDWLAAGATELWEFNQAATSDPLVDYIGACDQTSIVGTSVTTVDLPSDMYVLAAGGGGSTPVGRNRSRPVFQ